MFSCLERWSKLREEKYCKEIFGKVSVILLICLCSVTQSPHNQNPLAPSKRSENHLQKLFKQTQGLLQGRASSTQFFTNYGFRILFLSLGLNHEWALQMRLLFWDSFLQNPRAASSWICSLEGRRCENSFILEVSWEAMQRCSHDLFQQTDRASLCREHVRQSRLRAVRVLNLGTAAQRTRVISARGNTPELATKGPELSFSLAGKNLLTLKVDLTLILALLWVRAWWDDLWVSFSM